MFQVLLRSAAARTEKQRSTKKADVVEHPEVFDHVGLLVNGLPGMAGSPFILSSDDSSQKLVGARLERLGLQDCSSLYRRQRGKQAQRSLQFAEKRRLGRLGRALFPASPGRIGPVAARQVECCHPWPQPIFDGLQIPNALLGWGIVLHGVFQSDANI